jgi:hypothetical protein
MGLRRTIDQSISSSNYNLKFLSTMAIIIGVIAFVGLGRTIYFPGIPLVGTSRYILRSFMPTQTLTGNQVIGATAADLPQFNVRITGQTMMDAGYTEYKLSRGQEVTTAYYVRACWECLPISARKFMMRC